MRIRAFESICLGMSFQLRRVNQLHWIWRTCILVGATSVIHAGPVDISKLPPAIGQSVDFAKDVEPIFEKSCLNCHNAEKAKGKLLLDTREHAIKGGENGPDILPGDSGKSPLIHFTARLVEDSEMPPPGKGEPLSKDQVAVLRAWIDQGANWPAELTLHDAADHKGQLTKEQIQSLPPPKQAHVDFVKDIQPIFSENCYTCHGPKKQEAQ